MSVIGREGIVEINMRDNRWMRSSDFVAASWALSLPIGIWEAYGGGGDKSRIVSTTSWTQYHARVYVSPGTPVDVMVALRTNVEKARQSWGVLSFPSTEFCNKEPIIIINIHEVPG
jgi:hypothetical protein